MRSCDLLPVGAIHVPQSPQPTMTTHMRKRPKKSYANPWSSMTDIGRIFGLSAAEVGRLLKTMGLRDSTGQPTPDARARNLVTSRPVTSGYTLCVWHRAKVSNLIQDQGHVRLFQTEKTSYVVAVHIHDILCDMKKDRDTMSFFYLEEACVVLRTALKNTPREHKVALAHDVYETLTSLMGPEHNLMFLFRFDTVWWPDVESIILDRALAPCPRSSAAPHRM